MYGDLLMESLHRANNLTRERRMGQAFHSRAEAEAEAEADCDKHERGEARLISQWGLHQPPICGHLGDPWAELTNQPASRSIAIPLT